MKTVNFDLDDYPKFKDFYGSRESNGGDWAWANDWDEQLRLVGYPSTEFISMKYRKNDNYQMGEDEFLMFALKWS